MGLDELANPEPIAPSKLNSPKGEPISAASLYCRSAHLSRMPMLYLSKRKRQRKQETLPKPSVSTLNGILRRCYRITD